MVYGLRRVLYRHIQPHRSPNRSEEVCDARIDVVAAIPSKAPAMAMASYSPALPSPSLVATALVASAALAQVGAPQRPWSNPGALLSMRQTHIIHH